MIAGLVSKIDQIVEKDKKLEGEYLRWSASFGLKLIFFRNTFSHHRSPFTEYKSVILYRGHHSN